jgi:hypothetical protein
MTIAQRSRWDKLRKGLQSATKLPGARSALAREFQVSTATVSQWLSDDARQRIYPTAENTLRLLEWVTARKAQSKNKRAGSGSTQPALKTRKRKSTRNEKTKSGP